MSENNRIPADESAEFSAWQLPAVEEGRVVAVQRRNREPSADDMLYSSLTAGQLEEITQQGYEQGRLEGYQAGFSEGRAAGQSQGQREGLQTTRQQLQQQVSALTGVMRELVEPLAQQREATEQALATLAGEMALAIYRRELDSDPEALLALAREAVAALPAGARELCVYLNPQDLELISTAETLPSHWKLVADASLSRGGCRVETDHSVVDNTPEMRLARVLQRLFSGSDD